MQSRVEGGVREMGRERIDPLNKGLGRMDGPATVAELAETGWSLLDEEIALPVAVLSEERLQHNAAWMQRFIEAYGVKLAPHGKTTMAPRLFALQMQTGAWGITVATAQQARVAWAHGVRRVLMANQAVGRGNLQILSGLLADPGFTFYCLVDSPALVRQMETFFRAQGQRVRVLVELGVEGGRCGVRDAAQLQAVLDALEAAKETVLLCGVEVYEGVLTDGAGVRRFLGHAVATTRQLLAEGRFAEQPALLSGAGSAWYDVVAEVFSEAGLGDAVDLVLRPGCYLTHDIGAYREAQERILAENPVAQGMQGGLLPALQVWAYVQSVPEPGLAVIGLGKRDAAFDSGMPLPALRYFPGDGAPRAVPEGWVVSRMMDQHAYVEFGAGDGLRVGEMIAFDIAHPCLTFDKWRCLPVLDREWKVVDYIQTWF